ncbi:unnamed protein product [Heterobilharzia americana]|nr:unnamed protein product [Heterobilharzia americana]
MDSVFKSQQKHMCPGIPIENNGLKDQRRENGFANYHSPFPEILIKIYLHYLLETTVHASQLPVGI